MHHRLSRLLIVLFAFTLLIASPICPAASNKSSRIVAVGDVHGAYDSFVQILQKAGVIDSELRWQGSNLTLVQTGDLLDRGPKSRASMDLLMALEEQASKKKGSVLALLGNHEVMNMIGDLRYVPSEEYASYADEGSEKRRADAYQKYQEWAKRRAEAAGQLEPAFTQESRAEWEKTHPPGFVEQRQAFGPDGKYGRWLRKHAAIAEVNSIIFLHGGISPSVSRLKIKEINQLIRNDMLRFDKQKEYLIQNQLALPFFTLEEMLAAARDEVDLIAATQKEEGSKSYKVSDPKKHLEILEDFLALGSWLSVHPEGPLWFRGYSEWPEEDGEENITQILDAYGAEHFVVGHTVQPNGSIRPRFDGKVFLIDTGMLISSYPGGRSSALDIQDNTFTAIYMDSAVMLWNKTAIPAGVKN